MADESRGGEEPIADDERGSDESIADDERECEWTIAGDQPIAENESIATNVLVTGPPRSGKTTAIERAVSSLREAGVGVGGVAAPEIREGEDRVGFDVCNLAIGECEPMARGWFDDPAVGKYGVDVDAIDRVAGDAIPAAIYDAGCVVVDEIGPMQLESDRFVGATRTALDAPVPVIAAIEDRSNRAFVEETKSRDDVAIVEVEETTRDDLPDRLVERVGRLVECRPP